MRVTAIMRGVLPGEGRSRGAVGCGPPRARTRGSRLPRRPSPPRLPSSASSPASGAWWSSRWIRARAENQFDPSHAEWLHAKYNAESGLLDGAMNVAYEPMTRFNVKEGTMGAGGFTVEHGGYNAGNKDVSAERLFTAPCSSRSEYKDANGNRYLSAAILYTPTEPGRCLMFTKFQAHTRKAVQGAGKAKVTAGDRWRGILESPAKTAFQWYMELSPKTSSCAASACSTACTAPGRTPWATRTSRRCTASRLPWRAPSGIGKVLLPPHPVGRGRRRVQDVDG